MKFTTINLNSILKGFYKDNYKNRKLGRVGQEYDKKSATDTKEDSVLLGVGNKKVEDSIFKNFQGEENKQLREFLSRNINSLRVTSQGKISFWNPITINPREESLKKFINIGKESENYRKSSIKTPTDKEREERNAKIRESILNDTALACFTGINDTLANQTKLSYWKDKYIKLRDTYNKAKDSNFKYTVAKEVNEAARAYNYILKTKNKDCCKSLLAALKKRGFVWHEFDSKTGMISLNRESEEYKRNKEIFEEFLIKAPRTEFYKAMAIKDTEVFYSAIKYRFAKKYNKEIDGTGFQFENLYGTDNTKTFTNDLKKRDNAISLCSQLEFVMSEVFSEEERDKLIINNYNFKTITYNSSNYSSCVFSDRRKAIEITDKLFEGYKEWGKSLSKTNYREKFFVSSFCHELTHSLSKKLYNKNLTDFKEFAEKIGFKENYDYTIYSGGVLANEDKTSYAINNIWVEKDNQSFEKKILKETTGKNFTEKELENTLISSYANKSAQEAFAEYGSLYLLNKKDIDKAITEYNKDKEGFYKKYKDLENLSKYTPINSNLRSKYLQYNPPKWAFNGIFNDLKKVENFHKGITFYNMEILKSIQKCFKDIE